MSQALPFLPVKSRFSTSVRFRVRHPSWYVIENGVKRPGLLVPDLLKRLLASSHLHHLGCTILEQERIAGVVLARLLPYSGRAGQ